MVKRTNQWIDRSDRQTFLQRHGSLLIMLYMVLSTKFFAVSHVSIRGCLSVGLSVGLSVRWLVKLVSWRAETIRRTTFFVHTNYLLNADLAQGNLPWPTSLTSMQLKWSNHYGL